MTFGQLAEQYLHSGLPKSLTGRASHRDYLYIYARFFTVPEWRDRPLAEIHRYQVMELNQQLAAMPAHGNKVIGFIKQVFSWGQNTINPETRRPFYEGANPALRIQRHHCHDREQCLDHAQIALLLQTIDRYRPKYQAFYMCRLLVPCRVTELCTARRDAITPDGKWIKGKTKNGRPHTIYIARQAMDRLQDLPKYWRDPVTHERRLHTYYFTGQHGQPLTTDAVQKQWRRHRKAIDMDAIWLLDFRRTLATFLYRVLKVDDLTAKALLNHYDGRDVARYVRLDYDFLASILQQYADWVWQFKQEVFYEGAFSHRGVVGGYGVRDLTRGTGTAASRAAVVEQFNEGPAGTT